MSNFALPMGVMIRTWWRDLPWEMSKNVFIPFFDSKMHERKLNKNSVERRKIKPLRVFKPLQEEYPLG